MEAFFRGHGQWITSICANEVNDTIRPIQPMFCTSLARRLSVCGFFELDRNSEIEHRHNKTLEGTYCLYPATEHPDRALPPEIDWDELFFENPDACVWGNCPEDFSISSHFIIDTEKDFVLKVIDKENPLNINEAPTYLDTEHPLHSTELAIAISAWEAVLRPNPDRPKTGSRKKLIEDWLKSHHAGLNKSERDRMTTMLNPDKTGGAPKTE